MSALVRRLAKAFHVHIWGFHPSQASKDNVHLLCRCGQSKRVPL